MNRTIAHRGPDDEGYFVEENVGLAMRRLSIIDVATGHQPLTNEHNDIWIVFNGEIYNHAALRKELEHRGHHYLTHSDTETIIHAYEEYGADCVKHLRGMFSFAIWDRRRRAVFAARDRFGIKPFYYLWDGTTFLFASEIKAILAYPGIKAAFNQGTLAEYLAFGYITGEQTMFAGIRKLMPSHTLSIEEDGDPQIRRYWELRVPEESTLRPREYYVETYREMLESAVQSHLMSDVPLGIFLSGGLDSSAVAALATKIRGDRVKTFAVGYGSGRPGEEVFSELSQARDAAAHIGADHHEIRLSADHFFQNLPKLIWHEDEPITWPSSVSLFSVAQLAQQHVKVVLTGEGSDETLAGYSRYAWTLLNASLDRPYRAITTDGTRSALRDLLKRAPINASWHRRIAHTFLMRDGNSWPSFYFDNFFSAFGQAEQEVLLTPFAKETAADAYAGPMSAWNRSEGDLLHRLLHTDINSYLVELLMKQDQMSMAASIESRVPFLDHELVEFTLSIPTRFSVRGRAGKLILKEAVTGLLPKSITYQRKMGFPTPWHLWMNASLNSLEQMLLGKRALDRGLFNRAAVAGLISEQRNEVRDHSTRIWRLLTLEIWNRVFCDREPIDRMQQELTCAVA